MHLTRRAVKKWTGITVVCGALSFYWGYLATNGGVLAVLAMLLGVATIILMFATIESHPWYQRKRAQNALLARALDLGIKIRFFYSFLAIFRTVIEEVYPLSATAGKIMNIPALLDVWIGIGAISITNALTGISIKNAAVGVMQIAQAKIFLATYLTTITTALMHTLLLALLCGVVYGVLKLRQKKV